MPTKREWLAEKGLAIAGARGKFSNAAKEALAKAEAEGVVFSDSTPTARPAAKPTGDKPEPKPKSAGISDYLFPSDFRFPENEYVAVARDENGKRLEFSMRECCNTCRVSLTNHLCDNPTILGLITVKIEERKVKK